jgi:hypothetical protein
MNRLLVFVLAMVAITALFIYVLVPMSASAESVEVQPEAIEYCLGKLCPEVRSAVTSVNVMDWLWLYKRTDETGAAWYASALCYEDGAIYIRSRVMTDRPEILWHEAMHAHHFALERSGSDFSEKLRRIRGGAITSYANESDWEKVAEMGMHVILAVEGRFSALEKLNGWPEEKLKPFRDLFWLMYQYGFFSQEQIYRFYQSPANPFGPHPG